MHGSPCEMMEEVAEGETMASSPEEALRDLLASAPSDPEEFMAKLKESGYELKPISSAKEGMGILPPPPKMVIVRLDAARNALKGSHHG